MSLARRSTFALSATLIATVKDVDRETAEKIVLTLMPLRRSPGFHGPEYPELALGEASARRLRRPYRGVQDVFRTGRASARYRGHRAALARAQEAQVRYCLLGTERSTLLRRDRPGDLARKSHLLIDPPTVPTPVVYLSMDMLRHRAGC
jgi:hypothetical protein